MHERVKQLATHGSTGPTCAQSTQLTLGPSGTVPIGHLGQSLASGTLLWLPAGQSRQDTEAALGW